jgi:hypothetical protein
MTWCLYAASEEEWDEPAKVKERPQAKCAVSCPERSVPFLGTLPQLSVLRRKQLGRRFSARQLSFRSVDLSVTHTYNYLIKI